MANRMLTEEDILRELKMLDDAEGAQAGYRFGLTRFGDIGITRLIDGKCVQYSTVDLLLPLTDFSNRILRPLIAQPRAPRLDPRYDIVEPPPINMVEQITQQRGSVYGPFRHNAIVAQALKAAMRGIPDPDNEGLCWEHLPIDVREGLDLIALKISRIVTGDPEYLDNWDDIGGYAKIVADRIRGSKRA